MTDISQISRKGASQFRRAIIDPVNITMLLLLAVLAYLVIWPFVQLLIETLTWGQGDRRISRQAVPGEFTWFHWLQATTGPLSSKMLYGPLVNTLKLVSRQPYSHWWRAVFWLGVWCGLTCRANAGFSPF